MTEAQLYGICGAGLVGIGLYGAILGRSALRRVLAFNLIGSGVFILFGTVARRGGVTGGVASDPVPQALVITGLVVAFAATALAVALLIRLETAKRGDDRASLHAARSAEQRAGATVGSDTPGGPGRG